MPIVQIQDHLYPNIRALIFDKDGTLAQSHDYLYQMANLRWGALAQALGPIATPDLHDRLFQAWGVQSDQVHPAGLMAVGSRRDNELVTAGYLTPLGLGWIGSWKLVNRVFSEIKFLNDRKAKLTPPIPGLSAHLDRFQSAGLKLAILSADTEDNIQSFVHTWNLDSHFDTWVGDQAGLSKPDPRLLHLACDRLQIPPSEALVIGDSEADIELALRGKAAGAIGFSCGWSIAVTLPNAHFILTDLKDLHVQ